MAASEPTDGSKQKDPEPPRRARTAAEQRAQRSSGSSDPEVLAEEIERTREELAETLDAIADKVSPKRVTARTKKKVADSVKEKTDAAKESLHAGAASAREAAGHAKEQVQEKVSGSDGAAASTGTLADRADTAALVEPAGADVPPAAVPSGPPVGGVGGVATYGAPSSVPKEALAGAAAALVVVLLVLRRRRKKRQRGWSLTR